MRENIALSSFTVKLNGVLQTVTLSPLSGFAPNTNMPFTISGMTLENGDNEFDFQCVDTSGNVGASHQELTRSQTFFSLTNQSSSATYRALLVPNGAPTAENSGMVTLTLQVNGSFSGKITYMAVSVPFAGILNSAGVARFYPATGKPAFDPYSKASYNLIDQTEFDSFLGVLAFRIDPPATLGAAATLNGTISTKAVAGSVIAAFTDGLPATALPADVLNQPSGSTKTLGVYTVVFPSTTQVPALATNLYPQGDGVGTLRINAAGATLAGTLADGTAFTASSDMRSDRSVPIFIPLYRATGFLSGKLTFTNLPDSDVAATNLVWIRPAQSSARYYPGGWPTSIKLTAVGTKFDGGSGNKLTNTLDFGQGAENTTLGNASLVFTDGRLSAPISKLVSFQTNFTTGHVTRSVPALNPGYTISLVTSSSIYNGLFFGTLSHDGVTDSYNGALLNKGANKGGFGFFISTPTDAVSADGESGSVFLDPAGP